MMHEIVPSSLQEAYLVGESSLLEIPAMRAHQYTEIAVSSKFDVDRATQVIRGLINKHEALQIYVRDGRLVKEDYAGRDFVPEIEDLRNLPVVQQEERLDTLRTQCRNEGPSTDSWPLFEITYCRTHDSWRIFVSISLLLLDAETEKILMNDFLRSYIFHEADDSSEMPGSYIRAKAHLDNISQSEREEAESYWVSKLSEIYPSPEVPLLSNGWPQEGAFQRYSSTYNAETYDHICDGAQENHITITAVLFAIFSLCISEWSKSSEFTIACLSSKRAWLSNEFRSTAGNFGTTLPVSVAVDSSQKFIDFCNDAQEQMWEAADYQALDGIEIGRKYNEYTGRGTLPAFPIVFASGIDSPLVADPSSIDISASVASGGVQTPGVMLDHQIVRLGEGGVHILWDYLVEGLPSHIVKQMAGIHESIIQKLASDPDNWHSRVGELLGSSGVIPDDHAKVDPVTLHESFFKQAKKNPQNIAVLSTERSLTYHELAALAEEAALRLRAAGVSAGDLVPVSMAKGWRQIVSVLGILRVGAAYLPVDPALPEERKIFLFGKATAPVVLVDENVTVETVQAADKKPCLVPEESSTNIIPKLEGDVENPHNLAYVIYTSGSTGEPKGVAVEHAAAWNTVSDTIKRFSISERDRVYGLSSLSFDLSVFDIFAPLSVGGAVVLPKGSVDSDPVAWAEQVQAFNVTVWNSVPALVDLLLSNAMPISKLQSLRLILMSGDWIPKRLANSLLRSLPDARLISLGGATEASIWSIYHEITTVSEELDSIPYGRPLTNQFVYVLDDNCRIRKQSCVGQIYIAGGGLAREYLGQDGLTADRFIYHGMSGQRLYRTGDLGRYLPDGSIEFLGREDGQIKVNGYRVELGEIEAALFSHPDIESVIISAETADSGTALVSHFVARAILPEEDVREFLLNILPRYMVPTRLVQVERLPLTPNGKVDRNGVREMEPLNIDLNKVTPPVSVDQELVNRVLILFQHVLDNSDLSQSDNFFEFGGSSLSAVRLVSKVKAEFGTALELSDVIVSPTAKMLAYAISSEMPDSDGNAENIVTLKSGSNRNVVILMHPVGGSLFCYRPLVEQFREDVTVIGVAASAVSEGRKLDDMERLCERYGRQLAKSVDETATIVVGGWSMGGLLAHRIGWHLSSLGLDVKSVFLLDPPLLETEEARSKECSYSGGTIDYGELAWRYVQDVCGTNHEPVEIEEGSLKGSIRTRDQAVDHLTRLQIIGMDTDRTQVGMRFEIYCRNMIALEKASVAAAVPQKTGVQYNTWNSQRGVNSSDLTVGFGEVGVIPGSHYDVFSRVALSIYVPKIMKSFSEES